jgi:ferrous iron transport protein B
VAAVRGGTYWDPLAVFGFLAARVIPGRRSEFIMEMPPIRLPHWRNLLIKTMWRVRWHLGEAVPLFLVGTLMLFVLDRLHLLSVITRAGEPIVTGLLGLPRESASVFVMGFLRRDYGAAGLFHMARSGALTGAQSVIALTVMTLFVPCEANFLMMVKERGWRPAFAILAIVTPIAVFTGAALNGVFRVFGISF